MNKNSYLGHPIPPTLAESETHGPQGLREEWLKISTLIRDAGTQMRVSLNLDIVEEYSEDMRVEEGVSAVLNFQGRTWPALRVFEDDGKRWVTDGFHRLRAAERLGFTHFQAVVIPGTLQQAIEDSLKSNQEHGLRRTAEDKRRIVRLYLELFGEKVSSDRSLAKMLKVSPTTVGRVRRELEVAGVIEEVNERIGADGRVHDVSARRVQRQTEDKETQSHQTLSFEALDSTTDLTPSPLLLAYPCQASEYCLLAEHLPRLLEDGGTLIVIPTNNTPLPLERMMSWTRHEARLITLYSERQSALVWSDSIPNTLVKKTLQSLLNELASTTRLTLKSDDS